MIQRVFSRVLGPAGRRNKKIKRLFSPGIWWIGSRDDPALIARIFADVFVGREAAECLQPAGEVIGCQEVGEGCVRSWSRFLQWWKRLTVASLIVRFIRSTRIDGPQVVGLVILCSIPFASRRSCQKRIVPCTSAVKDYGSSLCCEDTVARLFPVSLVLRAKIWVQRGGLRKDWGRSESK